MYISHTIKTIDKSKLETYLDLPRRVIPGETINIKGDRLLMAYKSGDLVYTNTLNWDHIIHYVIGDNNILTITEYYPDKIS